MILNHLQSLPLSCWLPRTKKLKRAIISSDKTVFWIPLHTNCNPLNISGLLEFYRVIFFIPHILLTLTWMLSEIVACLYLWQCWKKRNFLLFFNSCSLQACYYFCTPFSTWKNPLFLNSPSDYSLNITSFTVIINFLLSFCKNIIPLRSQFI